jgi:hypothetical protein
MDDFQLPHPYQEKPLWAWMFVMAMTNPFKLGGASRKLMHEKHN